VREQRGFAREWKVGMTLLKKLIWWKRQPVQRVRICVECGMPVGEHKGWCSIQRAMDERPGLAQSGK
jgi:hypothetical protein